MLDFVISGSRGFIGGRLCTLLRAAGFTVASDREFAALGEETRFFVNCANIARSPSEAVRLLLEKIDLARFRAETFVQLQSFATLHGAGDIAMHRFNCGKLPALLDFYAAGKLEQERVLCRRLAPPFVPHLCLVYLPAVLGEGGSWSAALTQARAFGYVLPAELDRRARANWVDVEDLAASLAARHSGRAAPAFERVILNRAVSESLTWPEFLEGSAAGARREGDGPAREEPGSGSSPRDGGGPGGGLGRLRQMLQHIKLRLIAVACRLGILVPAERLARRVLGRRASQPAPREIRDIPPTRLEFHGLTRHIVATQPYIHEEN